MIHALFNSLVETKSIINRSTIILFVCFSLFASRKASAQATSLSVLDTRNDASTPASYSKALTANLKLFSAIGLQYSGVGYLTTIGLRGWSDNTGGKAHELAFSDDSKIYFRSGNTPSWDSWKQLVTADMSNNVGIGTSTPNGKLDVNGSILLPGSTNNTMVRPEIKIDRIVGEISGYRGTGLGADDGFLRLSAGGGTNIIGKTFVDISGYSTVPDMDRNITFGTAGIERMRITNTGIGIGTKDPKEALSVNGKIRAKEVLVETQNWPDYVFEKDYDLISLAQLKAYVDQHKHLPEIPSQQYVIENGINLGELVKLQTKKIEELTLYMIEKDEQVNQMKEELLKLKAQQAVNQNQQDQLNELKEQVKAFLKK